MQTITWDDAREWVSDENGNRCSVVYWGSEAAAEKALLSLIRCSDCADCSDCSRCSDCSYCSDCSRCSGCWLCSDCSDCSDCSGCSRCSGCSYCSRCSGKTESSPSIPVVPDLHRRVYEAASSAPDALDMSNWHTCETTHCRAGWIVHLAGAAGYALEAHHNTELAAMLIARKSGAPINPARFYDNDADALADMKRMAGLE